MHIQNIHVQYTYIPYMIYIIHARNCGHKFEAHYIYLNKKHEIIVYFNINHACSEEVLSLIHLLLKLSLNGMTNAVYLWVVFPP